VVTIGAAAYFFVKGQTVPGSDSRLGALLTVACLGAVVYAAGAPL